MIEKLHLSKGLLLLAFVCYLLVVFSVAPFGVGGLQLLALGLAFNAAAGLVS